MYPAVFLLSLAYVGFNLYHAVRGTAPQWIEKRLYKLRHDESFKDLDNKRWDTPVGILSKTVSLSVLFTSFIVITYLIGWSNASQNSLLFLAILLGAVVIAFFIHRNFSRRLHYYRGYAKTHD